MKFQMTRNGVALAGLVAILSAPSAWSATCESAFMESLKWKRSCEMSCQTHFVMMAEHMYSHGDPSENPEVWLVVKENSSNHQAQQNMSTPLFYFGGKVVDPRRESDELISAYDYFQNHFYGSPSNLSETERYQVRRMSVPEFLQAVSRDRRNHRDYRKLQERHLRVQYA